HLGVAGLEEPTLAFGRGLRQLRRAAASSGNELVGGVPLLSIDELRSASWVLTTFETWRDYQHSFGRVRWAAAVFDEAQKIKNPAAGVTEAAKTINADFVLAMTGTPVENRLADV